MILTHRRYRNGTTIVKNCQNEVGGTSDPATGNGGTMEISAATDRCTSVVDEINRAPPKTQSALLEAME